MTGELKLRLRPEEAANERFIKERIARELGLPVSDIHSFRIIRKSIDARQKQIWIEVFLEYAAGDDRELPKNIREIHFRKATSDSPSVIIVGAGPAGLFAALRALELGWRPIIVERGVDVDSRLRDIVEIQKAGKINPDSNYCFGEGGAGAFSDGKLFTRSKKRGDVSKILELLYMHGAREEILYEAHPHIGSDRLPKIIKSIRHTIEENGGKVLFKTKCEELIIEEDTVKGIITSSGEKLFGPVILATGHSARDIYEMLHRQGVSLESKGFAVGVRLEHPQRLIDSIRYHRKDGRGEYLPAAEYSLSCQVDGRGVYSFCMCPGGVIVPAGSDKNEAVVNGMSASARGGRWSNSGMVVEIHPEDFPEYNAKGALGMLEFQKDLEHKFFEASGNSINAPAQGMVDFTEGRQSDSLPKTSYVCGIHPARVDLLLPEFISHRLKEGFKVLGKKQKGFLTNEATVIGLESRTSSPVRIPRDPEQLCHPDIKGLYPAGEGGGYAGGIVSAAIDGERCMDAVARQYQSC